MRITAVHLTPEHPRCEGGTWDVEGHHLNEHIAATALYCYDSANVVDSSTPGGGIEFVYGIDANGVAAAVQEVGDVETKEGRMLASPNVLQHRARPFELADGTKPGVTARSSRCCSSTRRGACCRRRTCQGGAGGVRCSGGCRRSWLQKVLDGVGGLADDDDGGGGGEGGEVEVDGGEGGVPRGGGEGD